MKRPLLVQVMESKDKAQSAGLTAGMICVGIIAATVSLANLPHKSNRPEAVVRRNPAWSKMRASGRAAERAGQFDEAARIHEQAVRLATEGRNNADLAESLRDLADIHYGTGNLNAATASLEKCLSILDTDSTNDQMLDPVLLELAEAYTNLGKPDLAEPYLKRLLNIRRQVLPLDGKELMPIYARYISCLESQSKREQVQQVCDALVSGVKDWSTNRTNIKRLTELAIFLSEKRQYFPVVYLLKPVHEQVRTKLTEPNSRAASVLLQKLVVALRSTDRAAEADALLRQDISYRSSNWPSDSDSITQERQQLQGS